MNHILAVTCACITGITVGVSFQHKLQIDSVTQSANSAAENTSSIEFTQYPDKIETENVVIAATPPVESSQTSRESDLESSIQQLLSQQKIMASQQAELNRELNSIQFRLDTHSASFRPMLNERKTESIRSGINSENSNPLLPPR